MRKIFGRIMLFFRNRGEGVRLSRTSLNNSDKSPPSPDPIDIALQIDNRNLWIQAVLAAAQLEMDKARHAADMEQIERAEKINQDFREEYLTKCRENLKTTENKSLHNDILDRVIKGLDEAEVVGDGTVRIDAATANFVNEFVKIHRRAEINEC